LSRVLGLRRFRRSAASSIAKAAPFAGCLEDAAAPDASGQLPEPMHTPRPSTYSFWGWLQSTSLVFGLIAKKVRPKPKLGLGSLYWWPSHMPQGGFRFPGERRRFQRRRGHGGEKDRQNPRNAAHDKWMARMFDDCISSQSLESSSPCSVPLHDRTGDRLRLPQRECLPLSKSCRQDQRPPSTLARGDGGTYNDRR